MHGARTERPWETAGRPPFSLRRPPAGRRAAYPRSPASQPQRSAPRCSLGSCCLPSAAERRLVAVRFYRARSPAAALHVHAPHARRLVVEAAPVRACPPSPLAPPSHSDREIGASLAAGEGAEEALQSLEATALQAQLGVTARSSSKVSLSLSTAIATKLQTRFLILISAPAGRRRPRGAAPRRPDQPPTTNHPAHALLAPSPLLPLSCAPTVLFIKFVVIPHFLCPPVVDGLMGGPSRAPLAPPRTPRPTGCQHASRLPHERRVFAASQPSWALPSPTT